MQGPLIKQLQEDLDFYIIRGDDDPRTEMLTRAVAEIRKLQEAIGEALCNFERVGGESPAYLAAIKKLQFLFPDSTGEKI